METVRSGALVPGLALADDAHTAEVPAGELVSDTMMVKDAQGRDLTIMRAVRDENGDMVASDVILPSIVVASFRNVAERQGVVDLRFDIEVPAELTDSRWQLRLTPVMHLQGEELPLDPVFITGEHYRSVQLRGYERYSRFVEGIVTDTSLFIRTRELELFLRRNLPELYAFRNDSSRVSDEQWHSAFGITGPEAVEHYTDHFRKKLNERKAGRREKMFRKYVKSPIMAEALKLDTVVNAGSGNIRYSYVQTIGARAGLKKVELELKGSIYEEDRKLCSLPEPGMLTFYISSLSSFADTREKYLTKVVERQVREHSSCYIEFAAGKAEIQESLGSNYSEMARIKHSIREILGNRNLELDTVRITAFASPEGSFAANDKLAMRRAGAASAFFSEYTTFLSDSLAPEGGSPVVRFVSRGGGENWPLLENLLRIDTMISPGERKLCLKRMGIKNPDARERSLHSLTCYPYVQRQLYPRLRVVRFDFLLHRKGQQKDTIHTTIPDTVYRRGVKLLLEHDYEDALALLLPYRDFNTAVAFLALGKNHSALQILETLSATPDTNYMMAIIYSRFGDDRNAVRHYLDACKGDRNYIFRGSLDPEIASLTNKYDLKLYD
ncbi:MAG: hypothetical protein K6F21_07245 [Bacteroidales bacterium]|nr:hypothetical protein [Bacteroidales bacterium]